MEIYGYYNKNAPPVIARLFLKTVESKLILLQYEQKMAPPDLAVPPSKVDPMSEN